MKTYKCDIQLDIKGRGQMLTEQLFSVDDVAELQGRADDWYKRHAGADTVTIASYILWGND